MNEYEIPQMIDNFPQIMWFEADELVPIIIGMMAGSIFNMFTPAMLVGGVLSWAFMRYKRLALPGSLHHMCYWWGLMPLNLQFTNGLNREAIQ